MFGRFILFILNVKIDCCLFRRNFTKGMMVKRFIYKPSASGSKFFKFFFKKGVTICVAESLIGSEFLIVSVIKELL